MSKINEIIKEGDFYRSYDEPNHRWIRHYFITSAKCVLLATGETVQHAMETIAEKVQGIISQVDSESTTTVPSSKLFHDTIESLRSSFQGGCRAIARAITAGRGTYENPINGVPTADDASLSTIVANIKKLAGNGMLGTAVAGDVIKGKTFTNSSSIGITGTLNDYRSNVQKVTPSAATGNQTISIAEGAHNAIIVDRSTLYQGAYNQGFAAGRASLIVKKVKLNSSVLTGSTSDITITPPSNITASELASSMFLFEIVEINASKWCLAGSEHAPSTATSGTTSISYNSSTGKVIVKNSAANATATHTGGGIMQTNGGIKFNVWCCLPGTTRTKINSSVTEGSTETISFTLPSSIPSNIPLSSDNFMFEVTQIIGNNYCAWGHDRHGAGSAATTPIISYSASNRTVTLNNTRALNAETDEYGSFLGCAGNIKFNLYCVYN